MLHPPIEICSETIEVARNCQKVVKSWDEKDCQAFYIVVS